MKKLILAAFALTTAASVFAQGTINFNNNIAGLRTRVYAPEVGAPGFSQIGNGSIDTPASNTVWTGFVLIGAGGTGGQYGAATTLTTLLGTSGVNGTVGKSNVVDILNSLAPGNVVTTFKSGAGGGILAAPVVETINSIPADYNNGATLDMVAWDDSSTLYPTWTLASAAWLNGWIAAGQSGPVNVAGAIGGTINLPPSMPTTLESFNLYFIPEPSTFALAGLGAAAMLIFRRRK